MSLSVLSPVVELRDQLPLPLAQLVARAVHANSILERHQCVFYLGEVALKVAAVVRAAPLLGDPEANPRIAAVVKKLARASLGHWQELLREADRTLPADQQLARVEVPFAGDVLKAMVKADLLTGDAASAARKLGALGVFDALVAYRNAVIGHGSARVSGFYSTWTEQLARMLAVMLASPALVAGARFVVTETSEDGERRARVLEGTSSMPWDRAALPDGDGLWLVSGGRAVAAAPLVCHRNDLDLLRDRIGFLQEVRKRRADYLDYMTGEVLEVTPLPETLASLVTPEASGGRSDAPVTRIAPGGHIGGFELIERLGQGGQGEVYRARQIGLDRLVALKLLRADLVDKEELRGRFSREVRALVRTDHENVVKVYAAGEADGIHYYAMELIDGIDLAHAERAAGSIRAAAGEDGYWRRVADLFAGACDGVQHLHERGIVHRDLKPENLLLTADASRLVVTDLGLARLSDASALTGAAGVLGTLRSMAPEQLERTPAASAPAVDIFGLGVALFELATQKRMRDAPTDAAVVALIPKPAPRADKVSPAVPHALAAVIARAVEVDPKKRWPSAAAMAEALRALSFEGKGVTRTRVPLVAGGAAVVGAGVLAIVLLAHGGGQAGSADGSGGQAGHGDHGDPRGSHDGSSAPAHDGSALAHDGTGSAQGTGSVPDAASGNAPPGMVAIRGGMLHAGSTPDDIARFEQTHLCLAARAYCRDRHDVLIAQEPRHDVTIADFALDRRELSRGEAIAIFEAHRGWKIARGVVEDEAHHPLFALGADVGIVARGNDLEAASPELPITGVSWFGADALCKARGARLPTDDEWELAARGLEGRTYPWGDADPACGMAVFGIQTGVPGWQSCPGKGPRPVDEQVGSDHTPEGALDLAGNLAEWVDSAGGTQRFLDEHGRVECEAKDQRVLRGGSYDSLPDTLRGARRRFDCMAELHLGNGVRCAR